MSKIEIGLNVSQARFDIDRNNILSTAKPVAVSKKEYAPVQTFLQVFSGQPIIGRLEAEVKFSEGLEKFGLLVNRARKIKPETIEAVEQGSGLVLEERRLKLIRRGNSVLKEIGPLLRRAIR